MSSIIVGDDECPFLEVLSIFLKPLLKAEMMSSWKHFANALQIPLDITKKLHIDLNLDKITYADVVMEILVNWRSQNGQQATIGKLLNNVSENKNWKEIKDYLRTKIKLNANKWDDLDVISKQELLATKVKVLGKVQSLGSLKNKMSETDFDDVLQTHVHREFIHEALKCHVCELDNFALPNQLPYYIQRTLRWKRRILPAVFKAKCPDIFVFEGIKRHHLSILAQPELTDVSGNQLINPNVRFILLELADDFEQILSLAKTPVHKILYKNGQYEWVFSTGSLRVIRSFLCDESEEISEEALVKGYLSTFSSRPLAIASSPGMGKSVLLGNLAHKIKEKYPERFVLFIQMGSFFSFVQNTQRMLTLDVLKECIALFFSKDKLGKFIIQKLLESSTLQFEIFLDGFDEIPFKDATTAQNLLKFFLKSKNIRAHITSRLHLRDELENMIGVISYYIAPFQRANKISFFCGFWASQFETENMSALSVFAETVLDTLPNSAQNLDSDFAGIPLQCFLLATIYFTDARRFCKLKRKECHIKNPTKSLFEMYSKFIEIKFDCCLEDKAVIRKMHWVESLKLLFPNHNTSISIQNILRNEVGDRHDLYEKMLIVGILEAKRLSDPLTFIHRTFAEFMFSDLSLEYLKGNQLLQYNIFFPFLLDSVLITCPTSDGLQISVHDISQLAKIIESSGFWKRGSSKVNLERLKSVVLAHSDFPFQIIADISLTNLIEYWTIQNGSRSTYNNFLQVLQHLGWSEICDEVERSLLTYKRSKKFKYSSITFFLNACLEKCSSERLQNTHFKIIRVRDVNETALSRYIYTSIHNCVTFSYKHLLSVLVSIYFDLFDYQTKFRIEYKYCSEIINCAAKSGDLEVFKYCVAVVEKFGEVPFSCIKFHSGIHSAGLTPLHFAVLMGNYELTEYLIIFYGDRVKQMRGVVKLIFLGSWQDSQNVISNKVKIIDLLHSTNLFDHEMSFVDNIPCCGVAAELFTHLCDTIDYVPTIQDETLLLWSVFPYITDSYQFNLIVNWSIPKKRCSLLTNPKYNILPNTILRDILQPITLQSIYRSHPFDLSVIFGAVVICKSGKALVETIVMLSGDIDVVDGNNETMLHYAARYRQLQIMEYLLSAGANVNLKNTRGHTPLHCTLFGGACPTAAHLIHDSVKLLLNNGAEVSPEIFFYFRQEATIIKLRKHPIIEMRTVRLLRGFYNPGVTLRRYFVQFFVALLKAVLILYLYDSFGDTYVQLMLIAFMLESKFWALSYRTLD